MDDVSVHSHQRKDNFDHLDRFLAVVKETWPYTDPQNVSICSGSSQILWRNHWTMERLTDPEKLLQVVQEIKPPTAIKDAANVAKPLTEFWTISTKRTRSLLQSFIINYKNCQR